MRHVVKYLVCLAVAASAVAAGACLLPTRPNRPEADTWNPSRLLAVLGREQRRGENLDRAVEASRQCREVRYAVVKKVVAGKMSLAEAAGRFRELDAAAGGLGLRALRAAWPATSEEELYRRCVLRHAEVYLQTHPECGPAAPESLRAELARPARGASSTARTS